MYENRYVAFVDILGFSSLVRQITKDPLLYGEIIDTLTLMQKHSAQDLQQPDSSFLVHYFSDGVVLSIPVSAEGLWQLLLSIDALSSNLLQKGIFARGGVAKGLVHHDEKIMFGEGFLDAYYLESEVAKYPRIVISREVFADARSFVLESEIFKTYFESRIIRADDGPAFLHTLLDFEMLNRLPRSASAPEAEQYALIQMGEQTRAALIDRLDKSMDQPSHYEKIKWVVDYWNRTVAWGSSSEDLWLRPISVSGGLDDHTVNRLPFRSR
jgi:hypothetical protein